MKKSIILITALLTLAISASAGDKEQKFQIRFGWGGYPVTELWLNTSIGVKYDVLMRAPMLSEIYTDYRLPMYTTGTISAEFSWHIKKWFTLSFAGAGSLTWQGRADAITCKTQSIDTSLLLYVLPRARFNWVRRPVVKMYSSVGVGMLMGYDLDKNPGAAIIAQVTPVGIEVGRKVFGFCEIGYGMLYTGGMAGIGFRF